MAFTPTLKDLDQLNFDPKEVNNKFTPTLSDLDLLEQPQKQQHIPYSKEKLADWLENFKAGGSMTGYTPSQGEQIAGEIGLGLVAPEARLPELLANRLGRYGSALLSKGLPQAAISSEAHPQDRLESSLATYGSIAPFILGSEAILSQSPITRLLGRFLRAGAGAQAGKAVGDVTENDALGYLTGGLGAVLGAKGSSKGALRDYARQVEKALPGTEAQKAIEQAKRQGLPFITPGEATKSPILVGEEARLANTEAGTYLYEKGKQRISKEAEAIEKLFKQISNKENVDIKNKLYRELDDLNIPDAASSMYKENAIVREAAKDIRNDFAYEDKLKQVKNENDFSFANLVKRKLDEYIKAETNPAGEVSPRGREIQATKDLFLDNIEVDLDKYAEARRRAQRQIVRRNFENLFKRKELTAKNLGSLLQNKIQYKKLYNDLDGLEAQKNLEDLKELGDLLIPPVTPRTAAGFAKTQVSSERNPIDAIKYQLIEPLIKYFKGTTDSEELAKLITDPEWTERIKKILELSKAEKITAKGLEYTGKGISQGVPALINEQDNE
ncbi:hypothetical protein YTPLAS21_19070 [Candidatus Nitrosocosmicus sp.]|nr:hypothetical protein YTPLAS21_19070 [Candidatus Nitrosocosmicus sp.]